MDCPFVDLHTHRPEASGLRVLNLPRVIASQDFASPPRLEQPQPWYSYGIHPWWAHEAENEWLLLEQLLQNHQLAFIGETGIDKNHPHLDRQIEALERQITWSETYQKPLVLHNVKGTGELLQLHKKHRPTQAWVIHGFNGTVEEARQLTEKGFYLSVGDSILYENRKITKSILSIPLDHLFFETDETPIEVRAIYEKAAELTGVPLEVLKEQIFVNFTHIMY